MATKKTNLKDILKIYHKNSSLIESISENNRNIFLKREPNTSKVVPILKKNKIFVIGHNKTATTSVITNIRDFGFKIGNQKKGELLLDFYLKGDFEPIINLCKTADAFKDIPFSMYNTYKHLDPVFPNSKYILTVRDNEDEWYNSVIRFHTKIFNGKLPNAEMLQKNIYVKRGWMYEVHTKMYGVNDDDLYNKKKLTDYYNNHNKDVIEFFKDRPNDLLVLNLKEPNGFEKFCSFLEVENTKNFKFYHLLKTK